MLHSPSEQHHCIPDNSTSHPNNPIPEEPSGLPVYHLSSIADHLSPRSLQSADSTPPSSDSESPPTPRTDPQVDDVYAELEHDKTDDLLTRRSRGRRASTALISQNQSDLQRILGVGAQGGTTLVEKVCCGGGCCFLNALVDESKSGSFRPVAVPDNDAFRSLHLEVGGLGLDSVLTNIVDVPKQTLHFEKTHPSGPIDTSATRQHPPPFVTPHPPYEVYSAKVQHARELTKPGAEKRTYHFDLDVTDYPAESGDVDFVVGGAIGVCSPNSDEVVNDIFDLLNVPNYIRDKQVILHTESGRWPTIWGDERARKLVTTRRELLTWCSDLQSYPPTKPLFRLLAEYSTDDSEKKILLYLASAQGQAAFCDLRTGPHITVEQLLNAFSSSRPPLPHFLSVLNTLVPRFYSLSSDPQMSCTSEGLNCRRLIEIAVTVHETSSWHGGVRTGVGSGYFERLARKMIEADENGAILDQLDLRVPMFRGLMANPLAREFVSDGPMLLIGAGVGIAPFRGFVQRRLKSANCANKVWVLQGVRDSLLDELYSGEWGVHEDKVRTVVQSRRGERTYVQEEVRHQADLVWFIINALDGRVFVCGSTKGMGEGVEVALVDVAMDKGNLNREEAEEFWKQKKESGQYIAETW